MQFRFINIRPADLAKKRIFLVKNVSASLILQRKSILPLEIVELFLIDKLSISQQNAGAEKEAAGNGRVAMITESLFEQPR